MRGVTPPAPFGTLPPPKPFPRWGYWLIGGFVVLGLLCAGGVLIVANAVRHPAVASAAADVSIPGCAPSGGRARALLKVQNSTTRDRSYQITVAFESGGEQLDTALAVVSDLAPGQVAYPGAESGTRADVFTCRVVSVRRY